MASSSVSHHPLLLLLMYLLEADFLGLPLASCGHRLIDAPFIVACERFIVNDQASVVTTEVKNIISTLVAWTPLTGGFAAFNSNSIYGLAWCRDNLATSSCSLCLQMISNTIRADCQTNTVAARFLYYNLCYLRFDTEDFRGKPDTSTGLLWYDKLDLSRIASAHRAAFRNSVGELLDGLKRTMTTEKPMKKVAKQYVIFDAEKSKIFGMVQCSLDLSPESCGRCLIRAIKDLKARCMYQKSFAITYGSCFISYKTYNL